MLQRAIYCRSRSPVSLGIRVADGFGPWSHCAGLIDSEHVIECRAFRGVVVTPVAELIARSSEFVEVQFDVPDAPAGRAWARDTVGAGYDWTGALGVPWRRRWQHEDKHFCSEHLEAWLQAAGLRRFREDARGIGPNRSYWTRGGSMHASAQPFGGGPRPTTPR
jgi:hypothetical protein